MLESTQVSKNYRIIDGLSQNFMFFIDTIFILVKFFFYFSNTISTQRCLRFTYFGTFFGRPCSTRSTDFYYYNINLLGHLWLSRCSQMWLDIFIKFFPLKATFKHHSVLILSYDNSFHVCRIFGILRFFQIWLGLLIQHVPKRATF